MCLQCMTKSKMIVEQVLPGYFLVKALVGHPDWPKGWYGLVRCNDPDFVWPGEPKEDPLNNMPDSKVDKLPESSPILKKSASYFHYVEKMEKHFNESLGKTVDLMGVYALIQACKKAGYKEKIHGYRVMCWLSHHLAVKIKEGQKRPSRGISPRN